MKNKNKNIKFFALVVSLFGYGYNANAWDYGKHFYSRMNIYTGLSIGLQKGTWSVNNKLTFGDFITNGAVDSWANRDYKADGSPIVYRAPSQNDAKYRNVEHIAGTYVNWKAERSRAAGYLDSRDRLLLPSAQDAYQGTQMYAYRDENRNYYLTDNAVKDPTAGTKVSWSEAIMTTTREAGYVDGDGTLLLPSTQDGYQGAQMYAYQDENNDYYLSSESSIDGINGTMVSWSEAIMTTTREAGYVDGNETLLLPSTQDDHPGTQMYAYQDENNNYYLTANAVKDPTAGTKVTWKDKLIYNDAGYYVYNPGDPYSELKLKTDNVAPEGENRVGYVYEGADETSIDDNVFNRKPYYNESGEEYTDERYHKKNPETGSETFSDPNDGTEKYEYTNDEYNEEWYQQDKKHQDEDQRKLRESYETVYKEKIEEMGKNREIFQNIVLEDRRVAMVFGGGYNFYWRASKRVHPFIGVDFAYYVKMFSTFERGAGAYQQEFFNIKYKEIMDFHAKIGAKFLINENVALQTYGLIGLVVSDLDVTYKDNIFTSDVSVSGYKIDGNPTTYENGTAWNFSHEGKQKNMGFGNPAKQRLYGLSYGTGFEAIIKDTFILGVEYRCHRTVTSQVRLSNDFSLNSKFDISVHHVIFKFGFQFW